MLIEECSCSCVDGILVDGASWLIDIDTGESAKSTALGAATTGTGETTIVGVLGLKDFKMILRVITAQLQLLSDYYCWKDYADRDEIKD
ncbi:hypothetical protein Tco_0286777 [Tanacetum coccineum]